MVVPYFVTSAIAHFCGFFLQNAWLAASAPVILNGLWVLFGGSATLNGMLTEWTFLLIGSSFAFIAGLIGYLTSSLVLDIQFFKFSNPVCMFFVLVYFILFGGSFTFYMVYGAPWGILATAGLVAILNLFFYFVTSTFATSQKAKGDRIADTKQIYFSALLVFISTHLVAFHAPQFAELFPFLGVYEQEWIQIADLVLLALGGAATWILYNAKESADYAVAKKNVKNMGNGVSEKDFEDEKQDMDGDV